MKKLLMLTVILTMLVGTSFGVEKIEAQKSPIIMKDSSNTIVADSISFSGDVYVPIGKLYMLKDIDIKFDPKLKELKLGQYDETMVANEEGKVILDSGDIYVGEIKGGKIHGKGIMYYLDGKKYDGQWEDGKRNGIGTEYYLDGSFYKGKWYQDFRHGRGILSYENGDVYDGDFEYNFISGQGKITYNNTYTYEGQWENGKYNGKGILNEGKTFTRGLWKNGKLERSLSRKEYDEME